MQSKFRSEMTIQQRTAALRNIARGIGEWVPVSWTEVIEHPANEGDEGATLVEYETGLHESGQSAIGTKYVRFEVVARQDECYVGLMDAGQSGNMIAILANLAIKGMTAQEMFKRRDAMVFLELLSATQTLDLTVATILGKSVEWVQENWDMLGWGMDVVGAFLSHNPFSEIAPKVQGLLARWGMSPERLRELATGQKAQEEQAA